MPASIETFRKLNSPGLMPRLVATGLCLSATAMMLRVGTLRAADSEKTTVPAGCSALGAMPAPVWDGKTLWFPGDQGTLAVTALSDDIVRVHFTKAKSFGRDHSMADSSSGWSFANGQLTVKAADPFEPMRFIIEN